MRFRLVLLTLTAALACAVPRAAAAAGVSVEGVVASSDGRVLSGARVELKGNGRPQYAYSDSHGHFAFGSEAPGTYTISVYAAGYVAVNGDTVTVNAGRTLEVRFALPKAQLGSLTTIATVEANGHPLLSTSSVPSVNINAQQYAAQGVERVSDILTDELSTTVYPILGGGLNAPAVVALRGPDPSETLVDVDGHQVNNGNTGDFDLSLLDPADLQDVQVVYGIAPSALYGPNTLGGALNVVTIQPTAEDHTMERLSFGSFGTEAGTLEATGTDDRFGYAFSLHRYDSAGQLDNTPFPNSNASGPTSGTSPIGNDMTASSTLGNLRYQLGNGGFVGVSFHNQAVYRDLSAVLSSTCAPGQCSQTDGSPNVGEQFDNASGSSVASNNDAYGLDLETPLARAADGTPTTTAIFRHQSSLETQDVNGLASGSSPYLYNDHDQITDDTLEFDHALPKGSLDLKFALTDEGLTTDNVLGTIYADAVGRMSPFDDLAGEDSVEPMDSVSHIPGSSVQNLAQTQRWVGLSYEDDPTTKLHYSFATYYSDYTTFGYAFDPRLGIVWTPTANTTVRGSIGNTFQSPQLPTFIVPTADEQIPIIDGKVSIGNPNATAEKATSMDVGVEHLFDVNHHVLHASLDLYRTNLHNGVADYIGTGTCVSSTGTIKLAEATADDCLTYPVNVTHEVYEGVELRTQYVLAPKTQLNFDYDIDSAYIVSFPVAAADDVVPYVQDLGVPLHKINLTIEHQPNAGLSYFAGVLYEGQYNELNLPPFATVRAGITWHMPRGFDVAVVGENLTNAYDFLTTRENGGVPYPTTAGLAPTPAYALPGRRFTVILTHRT